MKSFNRLDDAVSSGELLHFFPEGSFTPATGMRPFRLGAFALAARHQLLVVPVAIRGTRDAWRDGTKLIRRGRLEVEVLPAIDSVDREDFRGNVSLCKEVRERLAEAGGEPLLDIRSAALPPEAEPEAPPPA